MEKASNASTRYRRCAVLFVEPREQLELDPRTLLAGGSAVASRVSLLALAPHLDEAVEIDRDEIAALAQVGETIWHSREALLERMRADVLDRLVAKGLFVGDGEDAAAVRVRDGIVRDGCWKPLSAVAHAFSRWSETGVEDDVRITPHRTLADLVEEYGPPPPHLVSRGAPERRVSLASPPPTAIDDVLSRRATCRNFDTTKPLDARTFGAVLRRVVGSAAEVEVLPGVKALKKSHPSGGALHPLEPYLLVRSVAGIDAGLYHYHAVDHALEPLAPLEETETAALALRCVANQAFLADAHVLLILAARFRRTFWKYRNHPKAYRAIVLEAGHVSQNLYLSAAELGLGAFVTAAINEIDIERALGLDPLEEGPIAVCGFGVRAAEQSVAEFDPLERVWNGRRLK